MGGRVLVESMTGFATAEGASGATAWRWEARSVNGKGLDLRLRLPEGWEGREAELRRRAGARLARGSVSIQLRVETAGGAGRPRLDPDGLAAAVAAAVEARRAAEAAGLPTGPVSPAALLGAPGVMTSGGETPDPAEAEALAADAMAGFDALLADLAEARAREGAALAAVLASLLDEIAETTAAAEAAHASQLEGGAARLREKAQAVLEAGADVPEERVAQELALLAVRNDVREELDRLRAHIDAARAMLAETRPIDRRLDFLTQEFNREANTLCSKSASAKLTEAGLHLKVLIDRLREQAQNVA